jgi:anthranilate phosphoribosyltransferase
MSAVLAPPPALRAALEELLEGRDLEAASLAQAYDELVAPATPPALQAAFLTALRAKGEAPEELVGLARALLARATPFPLPTGLRVDACGTGGDGRGSFNLSTAAALLVAALGIPVAKHGNRAVSSRAGSSDLAVALGLPLASAARDVLRGLARSGFAFLHAPHFHPTLAALAELRRALGFRTVFNLIGPLVNPAHPTHALLGAPDPARARLLARAAAALGRSHVLVVHGDGFDEATPCGEFLALEVQGGGLQERRFRPEDFGLARCSPAELEGGDGPANARRLEGLFAGRERGPLRDAVCLNAALVLLLVGSERDPRRAQAACRAALDDGRAARLLARLRAR